MRIVPTIAIGLACCVLGGAEAYADHAPVYVIPGRPGTPVVINGYDASYTVVEGDWGLSRPGHVPPAIVSGPLIAPAPYYTGHYFPLLGRRPGYGRREVEPPPNRPLPRPAPTYYREWSAQSEMAPATLNSPDNPEIEISGEAERQNLDQRRHRDDRQRDSHNRDNRDRDSHPRDNRHRDTHHRGDRHRDSHYRDKRHRDSHHRNGPRRHKHRR